MPRVKAFFIGVDLDFKIYCLGTDGLARLRYQLVPIIYREG
jgi:hypothetical protein